MYYRDMLGYVRSAVTRNYSEKSIAALLDLASNACDASFMERFYSTTLAALKETKNDRLWFKTNLKLANLWLNLKEYQRIPKVERFCLNIWLENYDREFGIFRYYECSTKLALRRMVLMK